MNAIEAAQRIGQCFDADRIPYGIGGALALGVWGAPRATDDVDLSAFVRRDELARVIDSLERAGVMIDRDAALKSVERIGLLKGLLGTVVIDVFVSDHPQHVEMAQRTTRITDPAGRTTSFISAEDLCLYKLVFGRAKDVTDLERLLAARAHFEFAYVRRWLTQMIPAEDRRIAILDDLERRFGS